MLNLICIISPKQSRDCSGNLLSFYSNFPRLSEANWGGISFWVAAGWQERSLSYLKNAKKPLVPRSARPGGDGLLCCPDGIISPAWLSSHLESARKTCRQGKLLVRRLSSWEQRQGTHSMSQGWPHTWIFEAR